MAEKLIDRFVDFAPHLIVAAVVFVLGMLLTKIVVKLMTKGIAKSRLEPTAHSFIRSMVKTALYILVVIITLSILQVPMSSIIATVGAAGVAIALALQGSLSNVAGGFLLMFTHPFRCGDFVEINGVTGTVKAITILYTRLLTVDNKAVLIPNGKVSSATIINYTYEEYRKLELHFSVSYNQDFHKAIAVIKDVISKNPLALNKPEEPLVVVSEHGESAIKILVRVCVKSEDYWELNYALLEQVKDRFDSEGIEIPYNKLDVQLKMKT